jgi:hypothetical protein
MADGNRQDYRNLLFGRDCRRKEMSSINSHHKKCKGDECHTDCFWYRPSLPKPETKDPGVEIKSSPTHGKGVFATRWWKPGELIGIYEGTLVTDSADPHVLWLQDDEERYFGIMATGDMGFLNHKEDNNAVLAANSPFIYARKNILPGEEIFISYWGDTEFGDEEVEGHG